jgi:hypothetical protein
MSPPVGWYILLSIILCFAVAVLPSDGITRRFLRDAGLINRGRFVLRCVALLRLILLCNGLLRWGLLNPGWGRFGGHITGDIVGLVRTRLATQVSRVVATPGAAAYHVPLALYRV